jgi:hypothetical protein
MMLMRKQRVISDLIDVHRMICRFPATIFRAVQISFTLLARPSKLPPLRVPAYDTYVSEPPFGAKNYCSNHTTTATISTHESYNSAAKAQQQHQ